MKDVKQRAPLQLKGAKSDIKHTEKAINDVEAISLYKKARKNLVGINSWHLLAGKLSARFYLTDPLGAEVERLPLQGDYIKIHLPSSAEGKFEWVRIEKIEEQVDHKYFNWINIQVRPSDPPREHGEADHFFSKEATSSFSVERKGNMVTAAVRGRNELPNTEARGWGQKIRNAVIALAAMAGLNTPQWKGLVKGILEK